MSTFEDIETQNARRASGRGRWRFSALRDELLGGRPAELEFRGDMREWMTMAEIERWNELFRLAHDKHMATLRDGREPLRRPRTSLPMLGPWAPPSSTTLVRLRYPDGTKQDVPSSEVTAGEWILYLPGGATARLSSAPTTSGERGP